jgi:precorrin-2 dehydrogenase/sirohydrochlorin ferrochelatase
MFYPAFLDLRKRHVLVVGGGAVAERKVDALLAAEAIITVVSPSVTEQIQTLNQAGTVTLQRRTFVDSDLDGMALVISATDDPETQKHVAAAARAKNIFINTVDQTELCDFIVPAVVRRGDVLVAISTSGQSPALAGALRSKLESVLTEDVARAARVLGSIRPEVHERFADAGKRKVAFQKILDSGMLDWIGSCDDETALKRVREIIRDLS